MESNSLHSDKQINKVPAIIRFVIALLIYVTVLLPSSVRSQTCETDMECSKHYPSQGKCKLQKITDIKGACVCSNSNNAASEFNNALPIGFKGSFCSEPLPSSVHSCSNGACRAPFNANLGKRVGTDRATEKRGGNLTIYIVAAKNLPNLDLTPLALVSDPLVKVSIPEHCSIPNYDTDQQLCLEKGGVWTNLMVRESSSVDNDLDPVWPGIGDALHFGFHESGQPINIEVLDSDTGLEWGDDLIANVTEYVFACSSQDVIKKDLKVGETGTFIKRGVECSEAAWVPLVRDKPANYCDDPDAVCLHIRMDIVPLAVTVDKLEMSFTTNSAGGGAERAETRTSAVLNNDKLDGSTKFSKPYFDDSRTIFNEFAPYFRAAKGGMILQTFKNSKAVNNKADDFVKFTVNFDCEIFIFRQEEDLFRSNSHPGNARPLKWMEKYGFEYDLTLKAMMSGSDEQWPGWRKTFKNDPDDPTSPQFPLQLNFGGNNNVVPGAVDINGNAADASNPDSHYIVILKSLNTIGDIERNVRKDFDFFDRFFIELVKFGIPISVYSWVVALFLGKIDYRLDRIECYLIDMLKEFQNSDEPCLLGGLFAGFSLEPTETDPSNLIFRRHLYYASAIIKMLVAIPFLSIFCFGAVCIYTVQPPAVGFAIIFVLYPIFIVWAAKKKWDMLGWRLSGDVLTMFQISFVMLMIYLIISPLIDPSYFKLEGDNTLKLPVDTFSVTCVSMALNMLPMMIIAFINDEELSKSFKQMTAVVSKNQKLDRAKDKLKKIGTLGLKLRMMKANHKSANGNEQPGVEEKPKTMANYLGDDYTIDGRLGAFSHSDPMATGMFTSRRKRIKASQNLYAFSLMVLLVYNIIMEAEGPKKYTGQAFGLSMTVVALDICFWLRFRGKCEWGPGYTVMLLILCRASLVIFCGDYWLIGCAGAYFVLGVALGNDIVNYRLKIMNSYEIGAVAFFGNVEKKKNQDIAASPEFVLAVLSFEFLVLLLAAIFLISPENMPKFVILTQQWPVWIFGLMAFFVVILYALSITTSRSYYLREKGLLSSNMFFFHRSIKVPEVLAAATYGWLQMLGLLMFTLTGSQVFLILTILLPVVIGLGKSLLDVWRKNDYEFLPSLTKPERRVRNGEKNDDDEEEEDDDKEDFEGKSSAFTGFALPPLQKGENGENSGGFLGGLGANITMPSLPMRSSFGSKNQAETGQNRKDGGTYDDAAMKASMDMMQQGKFVLKDQWELEDRKLIDPRDMLSFEALMKGKLSPNDYFIVANLLVFLFSIFFLGSIMIIILEDGFKWTGYAFTGGCYLLMSTVYPIIKYFNILKWTSDMVVCIIIAGIIDIGGGLFFWLVILSGDTNSNMSLACANIAFYYPLLVLTGTAIYKWHDDKWHDGRFVKIVLPTCFFFLCIFNFVIYAWVGIYPGIIFTLLFLTSSTSLFLVRVWAKNDNYLPPKHQKVVKYTLATISALSFGIGFLTAAPLVFFVSIGFLCYIVLLFGEVLGWHFARPAVSPMYVAQCVFPMYTYNPSTNNIREETGIGLTMYAGFGVTLLWGIFCIMFVNPIGLGVAITAGMLLAFTAVTLHLISLTPQMLGEATKCVDQSLLEFSGGEACKYFELRRSMVSPKSRKWIKIDEKEREEQRMLNRYASQKKLDDDGPREEPGRSKAFKAAQSVENIFFSMEYEDFESMYYGRRRFDAIFNFSSAMADCFKRGGGPLAFFCCMGKVHKCCCIKRKRKGSKYIKKKKKNKKRAVMPSKSEDDEEEDETEKYQEGEEEESEEEESEEVNENEPLKMEKEKPKLPLRNYVKLFGQLRKLDGQLNKEYEEEIRMLIHFQLLVVVAARSRIEKESTLFQMFLRENRFKLLANGVKPPADIFRSNSYATIDVGLVANWLVRLTPEQHERFMQLKERFSAELENRELIKDMEDHAHAEEEANAQRLREHQDWSRGQQRLQEFQKRRAARLQKGVENPNGVPEDVLNAREQLKEISEGAKGRLVKGLYGRERQWIDPDFPHTDDSIGYFEGRSYIKGWRAAAGINADAKLFEGGTDPDDVHQGILHNGWLLSAIQILAASGGVGDSDVDPLLANIFKVHDDLEHTTNNGAYAVRLFKNGQWEAVIVDDYFPVLDDKYKDSKSAGAAFAHSTQMEEIWVALLEKAMAKYYGTYSSLETGFVHFALQDLTGGESEAISITQSSRGSNKQLFWTKLIKYRRNKYLLGASTVSSDSADREILDSGLVFGACYTILQIFEFDGLKLLQLRNPPGDHGEWKGDWGDDSPLWTRRMKAKLDYSDDEDDGCFFMSFDDFCSNFKTLYVGRYYDPDKWSYQQWTDWWKAKEETDAGLPSKHNPNCIVANNPQFGLFVPRPCDLCITLSQTDDGMAISETIECAMYLLRPSDENGRMAQESERVESLPMEKVVAYTGDPNDLREQTIYCTLDPGYYTILCAAYKDGDEGPFTIKVHSNYKVVMSQIWPPLWKKKGLAGPEKTLKEKLLEKTKGGLSAIGNVGANLASRAHKAAMDKVKQNTNWIGEKSAEQLEEERLLEQENRIEEEIQEPEDEKTLRIAKDLRSKWKSRTDPSGKVYYYNKETGFSSFDKPEGFMEKREIRALEKKVETEKTRADVKARARGLNR